MNNLQRLSRVYRDMEATISREFSLQANQDEIALRVLAEGLILAHGAKPNKEEIFTRAREIADIYGEHLQVEKFSFEDDLIVIYKLDGIDTHMFGQDVVSRVKTAMYKYELAKEERLKRWLREIPDNWYQEFADLALDLYLDNGMETLHSFYTKAIMLLDINDL